MVRIQVLNWKFSSYKSNFFYTFEKTETVNSSAAFSSCTFFITKEKTSVQNRLISFVCAFWFFSLAKKMSCKSSGFSIAVQRYRKFKIHNFKFLNGKFRFFLWKFWRERSERRLFSKLRTERNSPSLKGWQNFRGKFWRGSLEKWKEKLPVKISHDCSGNPFWVTELVEVT